MFFGGDSIKCIYDNVPQPPPNSSYSWRFYGKRVSDQTIDVDEHLQPDIIIFPNPIIEYIFINTSKKIKEMILQDVCGRLVRIVNEQKMDVSDLPEGMYFIRVQTDQGEVTKKIIISR